MVFNDDDADPNKRTLRGACQLDGSNDSLRGEDDETGDAIGKMGEDGVLPPPEATS